MQTLFCTGAKQPKTGFRRCKRECFGTLTPEARKHLSRPPLSTFGHFCCFDTCTTQYVSARCSHVVFACFVVALPSLLSSQSLEAFYQAAGHVLRRFLKHLLNRGFAEKSTLWTDARVDQELSERFGSNWSIWISGENRMDQWPLRLLFRGNSYGPMALKVHQKFPLRLALVHGWLFPVLDPCTIRTEILSFLRFRFRNGKANALRVAWIRFLIQKN